jgi:hypothetical protein
MAHPKRDTHFIVLSLLVSFSILLLLGLIVLLFAQLPGTGIGPTPSVQNETAAGNPPDFTSPGPGDERQDISPPPAPEDSGAGGKPLPTFGTGAMDDFESNDWEGGTGQWAEGHWQVSDGGGSRAPDLRLQDDQEIQPYRGQYMARVRDQGKIHRAISLKGADKPYMTFHWAYSGLEEEGEKLRLSVNKRTLVTFDLSQPEYSWKEEKLDLSRFTGEKVEITFSIDGEDRDDIGYIDEVQIRDAGMPQPQL